jgi:group I intron endonuclease
MTGIYKIQSKTKPERIYIGSAININDRWWLHKKQLKTGTHHSIKLQRHYNKYSESDLVFEIIESNEYVGKEHLLAREQGWFIPYSFAGADKPYFNECKKTGNTLGFNHSKETISKISIAQKGKKLSEEIIARMSVAQKKREKHPMSGKHHSEETKKKISEYHKGKPNGREGTHHSEATKIKISTSLKDKKK